MWKSGVSLDPNLVLLGLRRPEKPKLWPEKPKLNYARLSTRKVNIFNSLSYNSTVYLLLLEGSKSYLYVLKNSYLLIFCTIWMLAQLRRESDWLECESRRVNFNFT